jgi:hypothetical protein
MMSIMPIIQMHNLLKYWRLTYVFTQSHHHSFSSTMSGGILVCLTVNGHPFFIRFEVPLVVTVFLNVMRYGVIDAYRLFYPEVGGSTFLGNISNHLRDYTIKSQKTLLFLLFVSNSMFSATEFDLGRVMEYTAFQSTEQNICARNPLSLYSVYVKCFIVTL